VGRGPRIPICTFAGSDLSSCRKTLGVLLPALARIALGELARQAGVDVPSVTATVATGLNSAGADAAKAILREANRRLSLEASVPWSSRLRDPHYEEQGKTGRSVLAIAITVQLPKKDLDAIHSLWQNRRWTEVEAYRNESRECQIHQ
jgi:hypothetical protein